MSDPVRHMENPFPAYTGNDPYVFVSYSHEDEIVVGSEIRWLQDKGVNVWFDEGIIPGHEWTDTLAVAIQGCELFVYFITPRSVESEYCRKELTYAGDQRRRVLSVYLEPTDLPGGLQLSLGFRQGIFKNELSEADYRDKLVGSIPFAAFADDAKPFHVPRHGAPGTFRDIYDERPGILVLPFKNRSADKDIDYFCSGIADEIMTALSGVQRFRVIAQASANKINAERPNLRSLHQQLNVLYALQGTVQKVGDILHITGGVTNTRNEELLWGSKWDCDTSQIFETQETIAIGVVDALKIQLSASQKAHLRERRIPDLHAYEYYHRARQLIYQFTAEALNQALDYLQRGLDIVGQNEHIMYSIGHVHWQFINAGVDPDPSHLAKAREWAEKLLAMDPDSPEGHRLIGLVNTHEQGAVQDSIRNLRIALEADPNDTDTLLWLAVLYGFVGRVSSGRTLADRLLKLDPLTTLPRILPGLLDMMDGDFERGCERLHNSHEMNPGNPITTLAYAQVLAMHRQNDDAEKIFESLEETVPGSFFSQLGRFYIQALHKNRKQALAAATDELKKYAGSDFQYSWSMAQCYCLIDETNEAIHWLENAVKYGFWNYPLLSERDPLLAPVRTHEHFSAVMDDLQEKWNSLES